MLFFAFHSAVLNLFRKETVSNYWEIPNLRLSNISTFFLVVLSGSRAQTWSLWLLGAWELRSRYITFIFSNVSLKKFPNNIPSTMHSPNAEGPSRQNIFWMFNCRLWEFWGSRLNLWLLTLFWTSLSQCFQRRIWVFPNLLPSSISFSASLSWQWIPQRSCSSLPLFTVSNTTELCRSALKLQRLWLTGGINRRS